MEFPAECRFCSAALRYDEVADRWVDAEEKGCVSEDDHDPFTWEDYKNMGDDVYRRKIRESVLRNMKEV